MMTDPSEIEGLPSVGEEMAHESTQSFVHKSSAALAADGIPTPLLASAPIGPSDREILRAFLHAGRPVEEGSGFASAWSNLAFDPERLTAELLRLVPERSGDKELRTQVATVAQELATDLRLEVARMDDLVVPLGERTVRVPRQVVGEALGPLGSDLFANRRRARRQAAEAARELAYFGHGPLGELLLPPPFERIRKLLGFGGWPPFGREPEPVLLDEEGPLGRQRWTVCDLLTSDRYFNRKVGNPTELERLQQRLREDPLDGTMVSRLRDFFARRLTVGVRDTMRWALGSRHPWFGWKMARELLEACFDRWGAENFFSPRYTMYTWDVDFPRPILDEVLVQNRKAAELFAERLDEELPTTVSELLTRETLVAIAEVALDYHCDHPDFDVEAVGRQQGETSVRFLGQAAVDLAKGLAGWPQEPLRNVNFAAHFEALGLNDTLLGRLDGRQKTQLFQAIRKQIRRFVAQSSGRDGYGRTPGYHRPPLMLYTFYESPVARPQPGEKVLDSFRLSELRAPRFAQHLRRYPELVGKLVVFFTLVLRHYLDTDHVPDLRPNDLVRDFMLLGIWGYDTQNLIINLYEHETTGHVRTELRFIGRTQFKNYRADEDRTQEAALVRKAVSHLGPLLEPSMLRALGNFLMAYAEATQGLRGRTGSKVSWIKHGLEVFRETARGGLRAGLVDLEAALEVVVDDGVDAAQRALDRVNDALTDENDGKSDG